MTGNPLRSDPTRTGLLQRKLAAELNRLLSRWQVAAVGEVLAAPTLNAWTDPGGGGLGPLLEWLKRRATDLVIRPAKFLLQKFLGKGVQVGTARAVTDSRRAKPLPPPVVTVQVATALGTPASKERVALLVARSLTGLQGLTDATAAGIGHLLAEGFAKGQNPKTVAREIVKQFGLTKYRAETIARTECLTPDSLVNAAVVRAVFRRRYHGPIVQIKTRHGHQLTATPNHPVLTPNGWVAAELLQHGDYVVRDDREQYTCPPTNLYDQGRVPTVSEVFDAVRKVGIGERKTGSYADFHGDGSDGEVEIFRTDRPLTFGRNPSVYQPLVQGILSRSYDVLHPSSCPLCGRLMPVDQGVCLTCRSQRDTGPHETLSYPSSVNSILDMELADAFTTDVLLDQLIHRYVLELVGGATVLPGEQLGLRITTADPVFSQNFPYPPLVPTLHFSDFPLGHTGQVQLDDVVSVLVREFSGHVYNLETENGYYTTDSLYSANCIRAHAEGQLIGFEAMGVTKLGVRAEWKTAGDHKVCPACHAMEGKVFTLDQARGRIPAHPNCVAPWTKVSSQGLLAVTRAVYSGSVFDLITSSGSRLTTTPNHMVLTRNGWVFVKDLRDGDYVVHSSAGNGTFISPHEHNQNSTIAEIFKSTIELTNKDRITQTLPMPHHLHGDGVGVQLEIQTVAVEGELGGYGHTSSSQQMEEGFFGVGNVGVVQPFSLPSQRTSSQPLSRLASAADRLVCGLGITPILLARSLTHHQTISGELPTVGGVIEQDNPCHCATTHLEPFVDRIDTEAARVELDNLITGKLTRVERVVLRHVSDLPVYDMTTESTAYVAEDIITSNCRCAWIPYLPPSLLAKVPA